MKYRLDLVRWAVRLRACFFPNSNQICIHNLRLKQTIMATLAGSGFRAAQVLTASRGLRRSELLNWYIAV